MKEVPLNLPAGAHSIKQLYDEYPLDQRDEDILMVELPNGFTVDVGYWPQLAPKGKFRIDVYSHEHQMLHHSERVALKRIAGRVEALAALYALEPPIE